MVVIQTIVMAANRYRIVPSVLLLLLSAGPLLAQSSNVEALLRESDDFREREQLTSAYDSARKALKLAKGSCEPCERKMVALSLEMERPHDAAADAAGWASHASTPKERSDALVIQARALLLENHDKHNDSLLKHASDALTQALAATPDAPEIVLMRGRVLALLKNDAEARAQFQHCISLSSATPLQRDRAQAYLKDMALVQHDEAPDFTITTVDGKPVSLHDQAGKVVLIDFWATWCGPCLADSGYVQSIASQFAGKDFVLLGISGDHSENAWKKYLGEHRMLGVQGMDQRHAVRDLFHVNGIPTYLILDGNGIVRYRTTGALKDLRSRVQQLIDASGASAKTMASAGQ